MSLRARTCRGISCRYGRSGCLACLAIGLWLIPHTVAVGQNVTGYQTMNDPFLFLIREPAVWKNLALSPQQRQLLQQFNDEQDGRLLATRNKKPEDAQAAVDAINTASRQKISEVFDDGQQRRLKQITLRLRGVRLVIIPELVSALALSEQQQSTINERFRADDAKLQSLRERQAGSESQPKLVAEATAIQREEQQAVLATLTAEQNAKLGELVGAAFPFDELGKARFKAPAIDVAGGTVNGPLPTNAGGAGDLVTVVHFFAFECINCRHNYPAYLRWQQEFAGKKVAIVGIHTPELGSEHDVAVLEQRLASEGLKFPVVVDNAKKNWDTWGNSMWPSVYLIDKHGYLRYWWYGELNWQGAPGERQMRQRIEELLAETP